jgi:hypothetical protein
MGGTDERVGRCGPRRGVGVSRGNQSRGRVACARSVPPRRALRERGAVSRKRRAASVPRGRAVPVLTRGVEGYGDFQVPEPWVGEITVAPIPFVSSNPSIGGDGCALGSSSDEALLDSHHHAFGGGARTYVVDGTYTTTPEGEPLDRVGYWVSVRARARELIADAVPGRDYALTEAVHCKSRDEVGVVAAAEIARRHLGRVLAPSPAPVVIAEVSRARDGLLWRTTDVGISVPGLLRISSEARFMRGLARLGGSRSTPAKTLSAHPSGAKGGWPRAKAS